MRSRFDFFSIPERRNDMASTHPLPVPERQPEPAAPRTSVPRPLPDTRKPRFAIRVRGMIPN